MQFAPDGRLFVAERGGTVRVVKDGELLTTPFVSLNVFPSDQRGLMGLTLDPQFETNNYIYLYYTSGNRPYRNRVVRFTADGDVAVPRSERAIVELDPINPKNSIQHIGGSLNFGPDGKLYITVGDLGSPERAQRLNNRAGKVLRVNPNGSIPIDNPFYSRLTGPNRAIWAFGLRNPYTSAFDPVTGKYYINDVGYRSWEEINVGVPGANYGWPHLEGSSTSPGYTNPLYAYPHGAAGKNACAITAGTFYRTTQNAFPASFQGKYFFADLCGRWIHMLDPANGGESTFATDTTGQIIGLAVDPKGNLNYLAFKGDRNSVYSIEYTGP